MSESPKSPQYDALRKLSQFEEFDDSALHRIVDAGTYVTIPAHWALIWEKTPADKAYIIVSGEVSVRKGKDEVARLGAGDVIGEVAIVRHRLRTASVVSVTPLEVLHFTSETADELLNEVPEIHAALERTSVERLGETPAGDSTA